MSNPKRLARDEDVARIREWRAIYEDAEGNFRAAVVDALLNGAGVRAVSEISGLSASTVQRWGAEAKGWFDERV